MADRTNSQLDITIFRGWDSPGNYVWSPFVIKVEVRLRFAGVTYRAEVGSLSEAPKGKIPYATISDEDNNAPHRLVADSSLIVQDLVDHGHLEDLNSSLSDVEKAHDLALCALLEDKLYFYQGYERWHQNYYTMRSYIFSAMVYPLQVIVGFLAYRGTMAKLNGQGTGRFLANEIASFRRKIWHSIEALLQALRRAECVDNTRRFWTFGAETPTEADTVLFSFICSTLVSTAGPESRGTGATPSCNHGLCASDSRHLFSRLRLLELTMVIDLHWDKIQRTSQNEDGTSTARAKCGSSQRSDQKMVLRGELLNSSPKVIEWPAE